MDLIIIISDKEQHCDKPSQYQTRNPTCMCCKKTSILYGLHAWGNYKNGEINQVEKIQADILKGIFNLPSSTPYTGIMMETGIWPVVDRVNYATLMFYHSIINSEQRLVTELVLGQEQHQIQNTFHSLLLIMSTDIIKG